MIPAKRCCPISAINGIIQGALPPIALAVLFILLPIVLRLFARFEGIPLHTAIELSLMTRYFLFKVIHGFLIVTLASGLVNAIPKIASNPGSAVTILATQLPAASTFFLTYFVRQPKPEAGSARADCAPLCRSRLLSPVPPCPSSSSCRWLSTTSSCSSSVRLLAPFSTSNTRWLKSSGALWSVGPRWPTSELAADVRPRNSLQWPNMTLLTVIGLAYSIIAPLICGFACVSFALFWFVYKVSRGYGSAACATMLKSCLLAVPVHARHRHTTRDRDRRLILPQSTFAHFRRTVHRAHLLGRSLLPRSR